MKINMTSKPKTMSNRVITPITLVFKADTQVNTADRMSK